MAIGWPTVIYARLTKDLPNRTNGELTQEERREKNKVIILIYVHFFSMMVPFCTLFINQQKANKIKRISMWHFALLCPSIIVYVFLAAVNFNRFPWLVWTSCVLIILQFIVALIEAKYDLYSEGHRPLITKDKEILRKIKFYEERKGEKKYLSVKESRAFRIENVGGKTISKIWIVRHCSRGDSKLVFKANFDLEEALLPGKSIVIIPESHTEEGAIKALDYRSFGLDKTRHLKTSVTFPNPENETFFLSVEYNEIYNYQRGDKASFIEDRG